MTKKKLITSVSGGDNIRRLVGVFVSKKLYSYGRMSGQIPSFRKGRLET